MEAGYAICSEIVRIPSPPVDRTPRCGLGTWIGGFAYSNLLSAIFLAVGTGAILQVIYEVGRLLLKDSARARTPALSETNLGGLTAGIAVMYATALLVTVQVSLRADGQGKARKA